MKTQVVTNEDFNGRPMFKIYEVDDNNDKAVEFDRKTGEKAVKRPIVSIGLTKAKAIVKHANRLIGFAEEN